MFTTGDIFRAALKHKLAPLGRGSQGSLASQIGVANSTISEIKSGRSQGSIFYQEKIAAAFGYDLIDFLALGKKLLEESNSSPLDKKPIPALPAPKNTRKGVLELYLENHPTTEPEVLQCGKTWYLADKRKIFFKKGARFLVELADKKQIVTAVEFNGVPAILFGEKVIQAHAWGKPLVIGRIVLIAEEQ